MPNDLLKTIGDYLNPEDVLTLAGPLAAFKPTAGVTAAMYAPSLNENEAEELDKIRAMRPPVAAPRETAQTPEMRDFVNRLRYEQFVGDLRKQYGQHADLMLQGLIKQGLQDEAQQARMTGPRAKPPAPPAARHEATVPEGRFRRYAEGGMIEHTTPDMSDGGRMIYTDSLDSYSGGGGVKGKTVQQMAEELITKGIKTGAAPSKMVTASPSASPPKLPMSAQEMQRMQESPARNLRSLGESIDREVRKVRRLDELGKPGASVGAIPAPQNADVPGWHITSDFPGILKTGAMTNRDVGANNIQGYPPAHVGGAYFYSDPRLALNKRDELLEMVGYDPDYAAEIPILRAQLRQGNRLVSDEDVGLNIPWQKSFEEGSFATTRPVLLNQIDRIYAENPDLIKDIIRDTVVRQRRYKDGGPVQGFSKGGDAKKTVQQMADELLTKGVKTPDLSRRGFMRLPDLGGPKESKLPVPAKDMERFQTEKTTVDPLSGSVEKVVEKVAQTPMSRRQVLQGALAQTAQRILPSVAMQPVKDVASEVAKTVMKPTVFSPSTIQGAIAQGLKLGQSDEQILKAVTQQFGDAVDPEELLDVKIPAMRDPGEYYSVGEELGAPGPLEIFRTYTDNFGEDNLKQVMREIRSANPELYKTLKDAARDTDMTIAEMMPSLTYRNRLNAAQERALRSGQPFDLEKFKKRYGYEDLDPEDLDAEDLDYDDYD
jgi:hypothetical protein